MASEIEFLSIDEQFPVAGQDNDTQGFRDNFSIIKTGLSTAQSEITVLQDSTARLDQPNNFRGSEIIDAQFNQTTAKAFVGRGEVSGPDSGDITVSFINGHYQNVVVNASDVIDNHEGILSITLADWPASDGEDVRYASMRIELSTVAEYQDESATELKSNVVTVDWIAEGGGRILMDENWPRPFTLDSEVNSYLDDDSTVDNGGPVVVEFYTYNGGDTVFARYLGTFSVI